MKSATKVWLIAAALLILAGSILLGVVMMMRNWNFGDLSADSYQTNTYTVTDTYQNISIQADTAQITFVPSEDGSHRVTCYEPKKITHRVSVEDGTLVIRVEDTRKWYEHIGIFFQSPKLTLALPQGEYGALTLRSHTGNLDIPEDFGFAGMDITLSTGHVTNRAAASGAMKIKTTTGDICVESVSAASLDLSVSTGAVTVSHIDCPGDIAVQVSTGKAKLSHIRCKNLRSDGSTGDLTLDDVIAEQVFDIERSTGDIKFTACDAAEISVETDTGHITGDLLTDKIYIAETDTGRVDVPKTATGGKCRLTTDTGNIKIS